jgi:2-polyprenyl-6-methoxyphenol hydroxylase-like FAD-dependent oxidoreductase
MKPAPAAHDGPDVVVVGAGPVGLVAACELARHGLAVRVIDKLPAPTDESRAIVVHARSLEMFDRMGVAGEIIGYYATIADPDRAVASRYGLRAGGRVIIRPDGYIGYIGDLDATAQPYFSLLRAAAGTP